MPDPEIPPEKKPASPALRAIAKSWWVTGLILAGIFGATYFMLWRHHCPKPGECSAAFNLIREIFGKMLLMGAAIFALGGWGIYRAYSRRR